MTKPAVTRQAQLAAIHIAQKALGMTAEDAMSVKLAVIGQASAGTMTMAQRAKLLAHLSGLQGKRPASQTHTARRAPAQRSADDGGDQRWGKARALWADLARTGAVKDDTDDALMAYVKRQTHLEHWRFLNTFQINSVLESLKAWYARLEPSRKQTQPEGQVHG